MPNAPGFCFLITISPGCGAMSGTMALPRSSFTKSSPKRLFFSPQPPRSAPSGRRSPVV